MALTDWYCEEVLAGKLKVDRIFEDEFVLAFRHPRPAARRHAVVIPKAHVPSLLDEKALDPDLLVSMIRAVQHVARVLGVDRASGFYVRANAAAPGVSPHMHWHVLPDAGQIGLDLARVERRYERPGWGRPQELSSLGSVPDQLRSIVPQTDARDGVGDLT